MMYPFLPSLRQFFPGRILFSVPACRRKQVALTFDDGYQHTGPVLEKLQRHHVRATFFFVGDWAAGDPALCRRAFTEGHEIGSHTCNHPHLSDLSEPERQREVRQGLEVLEQITGKRPRLFRFPYLQSDPSLIRMVRREGLLPVGVSLDPKDWTGIGPEEITRRVLTSNRLRPGAIILLHTTSGHTVDALDLLIPALRAAGYEPVTVTELLRAAPAIFRCRYSIRPDREG